MLMFLICSKNNNFCLDFSGTLCDSIVDALFFYH